MSDVEISNAFFPAFARYHRAISAWRLLNTPRRRDKSTVVVLHGPTGTGKTQAAWCMAPDAHIFSPDSATSGVGWWDGYTGQPDVIIDDFYGGLRYSFLLQLLDRYPLRVQSKFGSREFLASRVIFTSNKHPSDWYDYDKFGTHAWPAFSRRLDRIFDCQPDVTWIQK